MATVGKGTFASGVIYEGEWKDDEGTAETNIPLQMVTCKMVTCMRENANMVKGIAME